MPGFFTLEGKPLGYRQITVSSTALALSSATGGVPKGATRAIIEVETDAIRYRDDGTAPTASVGMPVAKDVNYIVLPSLQAINAFRAIRVTTDAKLNVLYYGS